MKKKKFVIVIVCIGAFIGLNVLIQLGININIRLTTGYEFGTLEYEIASQFELQNYKNTTFRYVWDDDVAFAITDEPDDRSRTLPFWQKENGSFTPWPKEIISLGESISSLGFNGSNNGARLFLADNERYVFDFCLEGYPYNPKLNNNVIDIEEAIVYDNTGRELAHIDSNTAKYYFAVMDSIPNDFKVFLKYKGEERLLLDANNRVG